MSSYFEYNGQKSSDFGIKIHNTLAFSPAEHDLSEIRVLGRHGHLTVDNQRLEVVEKTIKFDVLVDEDLIQNGSDGSVLMSRAIEIDDWLGVKGWHNWRWSMYPGYLYKATISDPYSIEDTIRRKGKGIIKVKFFPVMYLESELTERQIQNNQTINHTGNVDALPLIRLVPNGTQTRIDVSNNGEVWFSLQNINKTIWIDSETMQVYTADGSANDKLLIRKPLFPILQTGNNVITFNAAQITGLYMTTRLGRKAI